MTGGEGEVVLPLNQQLNENAKLLLLQIVGPDTGHQRLQGDVAHQKSQQQRDNHGKTDFPCLGDDQQDHSPGDPEHAALTEQRDDGHDAVHQRGLEVGLNPVQNRQVKGNCQLVE